MFFWLNITFGIFYFILLLSAVITVLLDNYQPSETIAWVVVIVSLPVLGMVFYYFFGQNIRRKRLLGKKNVDLLTRKVMAQYVSQAEYYKEDDEDASLIRFFKLHSMALPFGGNHARFYTYGIDFLHDLLQDIGKAQHHIHLEFFIIVDDAIGYLVRDALLDAVKRGIIVRLIYDDVGCWSVPNKFFSEMEKGGIHVTCFQPVRFPSLAHRVNYRNHRKLSIIDGCVGYIGGMNLALRYVRGTKDGEWRDMQMRLRGGGVYGMQLVFLTDWFIAAQQLITDKRYYPSVMNEENKRGALVQIVVSAPFEIWPNIMYGYNKILLNAKKYVYLQTPYFMPTQSIIEAMQTAAMSGVKIQLMVPRKPGGFWITWANESYFAEMLRAGVEIYLYTPGMLHSKVIIADDHFCSVGSANLDFRSMLDTFEANAFIYDAEIAFQVKQRFLEARKHCEKIDLMVWSHRSLRRRLLESFVRIFTPLF